MRLFPLAEGLLGRIKSIFKKEYVVGLDIGSSAIKMVLFSEREDGLHLVRSEIREIKPADEASRDDETVKAIKYLLRGVDLKKSRIAASINCPQTAIKKVITPYMPKAELRDGIKLQSKNYFPFSIEDSLIDFEITGDLVEKGIRKYEVLVAACPIKTVDRNIALLEKSGVRPGSFISSSYALQKMAETSAYSKSGKAACFVDIGENYSELIISKGKSLMFTRKIPITGGDFTKAMTVALVSDKGKVQLTLDEAEKVKREVGIPGEGETKIIDGKISTFQILSMLRSPLEQLSNEIDRCFDYYREEGGGEEIGVLILSGGGSSLSGLIRFLSETLGIEVKLLDSLEGIKLDKDAVPERDKVSHRLGLAIGAVLSSSGGINLLPVEIKEEAQIVFKRGTIEVAVTLILVLSILFYASAKLRLGTLKKRIAAARLELSSLQPELKKSEAQALANSVLLNEPQWEDIFTELANIIPDNISINELKMEKDILTMKGTVNSEDGEQVMAKFIITLEKGIFSNVKLVETKDLGTEPGIEFELKCWVDYAN